MAQVGRKPGGPKTGGGSRKGKPNKASRDIRAMAQVYGPDCLLGLAIKAGLVKPLKKYPDIKATTNDTAQVLAMDKIMDRAYGKATQPLEHSVNESMEGLLDRLGR